MNLRKRLKSLRPIQLATISWIVCIVVEAVLIWITSTSPGLSLGLYLVGAVTSFIAGILVAMKWLSKDTCGDDDDDVIDIATK